MLDSLTKETLMKTIQCIAGVMLLHLAPSLVEASSRGSGTLTPSHQTNTRGAYTIETVGDTLHQAAPQNTRLIIRISTPDKKLIKPGQIALVDQSGTNIKPVFREDRKVGHEENTGLPVAVGGYGDTTGVHSTGVGVNLNKIFGPHGDYAYTKVDWPRSVFTAEKKLMIVIPGGQAFTLPLRSLAN
jgi:hypothetical protein